MIFNVSPKYRIASDFNSWMIQTRHDRRNKETGQLEEGWRSIKWYPSLEKAINGLADIQMRTSDASTLAEALAEVENVCTQLSHAFSPRFKVERELI